MNAPVDPAALVRLAYDRLFAGDLEGFLGCLSAECVIHEAESLPYGGSHEGRDAIQRLVAAIMDLWEVFRFDVESVLGNDEEAIAFGHLTVSGKHTGVSATFALAEHWRFENGKAVEITAVYGDTVRAQQAAGTASDTPRIDQEGSGDAG